MATGDVKTSGYNGRGEKVRDYVEAAHPFGGTRLVPSDGTPVFDEPSRDAFVSHCTRCRKPGKHRAFQSSYAEHPSHFTYPTSICDECWPLVFPTGIRIEDDDEE